MCRTNQPDLACSCCVSRTFWSPKWTLSNYKYAIGGKNPAFKTGENKFEVEETAVKEREDFMTSHFEDLAMTRLVPPQQM